MWELLTSEVPFHGLQGVQVAWAVVVKEEVSLIFLIVFFQIIQKFLLPILLSYVDTVALYQETMQSCCIF